MIIQDSPHQFKRHVAFYELPAGYPKTLGPVRFKFIVRCIPMEHLVKGSLLPRCNYLRKTWERHMQDEALNRRRDYLLVSNFGVSDVFRFKPAAVKYPIKSVEQIP